jgi:predicted nucleic acid-binding Zn ribbon protein
LNVQHPVAGADRVFTLSLPFFNVNEGFTIQALYTGKLSQCEVTCRLPDTTVEVYSVSELYRINQRRGRRTSVLMYLGLSCLIVVVTIVLYGLYISLEILRHS